MKIFAAGSAYFTPEVRAAAERLGFEIVTIMPDKVHCGCDESEIDVVVCSGLFRLVAPEKYTRLKLVQLTTAGYDCIPVEQLRKQGVEVRNARGAFSVPMAEFALGGVLQFYKMARHFEACRRQRIWKRRYDLLELTGKTVCIVGAGSIGSECAKRFKVMGCRVIGLKRNVAPMEDFDEVRPISALLETLPESDIVILCLPLTQESRKLIDKTAFKAMKDGTVLVNLARGSIVDEAAMIEALKDDRLLGAVLDVTENEPLEVGSPLWDMENVILTPHTSFAGDKDKERIGKIIIDSLTEFVNRG